jgi:hypothetical protein
MATLAVTNTFAAGTTIVAADMNTNFDDVEAFINTTPGVVQNSIVDVKGDLIVATAADAVARLAAGTNTHVLTADSTTASGLSWVAPTSGDITAVVAGTNISGGATSGSATVNLSIDAEVAFADQVASRPEMKDYAETVNPIGATGGGTQDFDIALGNVHTATVDTSANTFTFSNPSATGKSCSFTLILTNGASQTVAWPASVDWAGGTAPTLTAAGIDILTFMTIDAGTIWYGFLAGAAMA